MTSPNSTTNQELIPGLPDDISIRCLARIPLKKILKRKRVSQLWRSTIRSEHFYHIRSGLLINTIKHSLYINIRHGTSFQWYHLLFPNSFNETLIRTIPPIPFQPAGAAYAVVEPNIYVLGGFVNEVPTNDVWVLDSRVNKWVEGPKMMVARGYAASGVVEGKIYVMGGSFVDQIKANYKVVNWAEKLDQNAGKWSEVGSKQVENKPRWMHASAVIDRSIYAMAHEGSLVYDVGTGKWYNASNELDSQWTGRAAVVNGVLYCFTHQGKIIGYDVKENMWKDLRDVEILPNFLFGATMVDLGGRLCVVWECKYSIGNGVDVRCAVNSIANGVDVRCAVIEVEKDANGDLRGLILWADIILSVPVGSLISGCMAVPL